MSKYVRRVSALCAALMIAIGGLLFMSQPVRALTESGPGIKDWKLAPGMGAGPQPLQAASNQLQLPPKPFLTMPFEQKCDDMKITEGWLYSPGERSIHGNDVHYGIDFACPRWTPIVAMADGYAIRSYHSVIQDETYQGKKYGYGLGEFVQIWHPDQGVYTLYAHMSKAADDINYVETQKISEDFWNPVGIYKSTDEIMKVATPVKRGQVIGYVGDSGLSWGYNESYQTEAPHHVQRPDPTTNPSWDETHLHIEVYTRLADGSAKDKRYDPFDIYGQVREEFSPYRKMQQGEKGLWIAKEKNGKPCYSNKLGNKNCPAPTEE